MGTLAKEEVEIAEASRKDFEAELARCNEDLEDMSAFGNLRLFSEGVDFCIPADEMQSLAILNLSACQQFLSTREISGAMNEIGKRLGRAPQGLERGNIQGLSSFSKNME